MNEPNIRPFTTIEKVFAAENYEKLFKFIKRNQLDEEEYHDALILHFMAAIQEFCHSNIPLEGFESLLEQHLKSAVTLYKLECAARLEAQEKYFSRRILA